MVRIALSRSSLSRPLCSSNTMRAVFILTHRLGNTPVRVSGAFGYPSVPPVSWQCLPWSACRVCKQPLHVPTKTTAGFGGHKLEGWFSLQKSALHLEHAGGGELGFHDETLTVKRKGAERAKILKIRILGTVRLRGPHGRLEGPQCASQARHGEPRVQWCMRSLPPRLGTYGGWEIGDPLFCPAPQSILCPLILASSFLTYLCIYPFRVIFFSGWAAIMLIKGEHGQ